MMDSDESIQPFNRKHCNGQSLNLPLQQSNQKEDGTPGLRLLGFHLSETTKEDKQIQQSSAPPPPPAVDHHSSFTTPDPTPNLEPTPNSEEPSHPVPAPHIVLPVASLMDVVHANISICNVCNKCKLRLDYHQKTAVASKLTLKCDHCNNMVKQVELCLKNLERSRRNTDRRLAKKYHKANNLRFEIRYL